jgi:hypothetical protein
LCRHGLCSLCDLESTLQTAKDNRHDWLHNLPVAWMALVIFGATYLVAAVIYTFVMVLAVRERARSFKVISAGMLPPVAIIYARRSDGFSLYAPRREGSLQLVGSAGVAG